MYQRSKNLDYDTLAEAYTDLLGRVVIMEQYALRILTIVSKIPRLDP